MYTYDVPDLDERPYIVVFMQSCVQDSATFSIISTNVI
jgi:hypothetical protein